MSTEYTITSTITAASATAATITPDDVLRWIFMAVGIISSVVSLIIVIKKAVEDKKVTKEEQEEIVDITKETIEKTADLIKDIKSTTEDKKDDNL